MDEKRPSSRLSLISKSCTTNASKKIIALAAPAKGTSTESRATNIKHATLSTNRSP